MKLGVFDIKGREINSNDRIKYWNLYYWSGSSEEIFGTEPQVSFHVNEMYPEQLESDLYFINAAYCVKKGDSYITLNSIIKGIHHCLDEIIICEPEKTVDEMFSEAGKTVDEFRDMLRELEIISKNKQ